MTILKFQERFKREKILKTSKIRFYNTNLSKKLIARTVIDLSCYILTVLFILGSFFNPSLLFSLIILVPLDFLFLYHQIHFLNKVFVVKTFLTKKYTSDQLELMFRGKNCFDQTYLVYSKKDNTSQNEICKRLLNLAFVSDIHYGNSYTSSNFGKLEKIANIVNSLPTEIFIFGGDLLNTKLNDRAFTVFNLINKKYKLGVWGNHDSYYLKEQQQFEIPKKFIAKCEENGLKILNNESIIVKTDENLALIGGIGDMFSLSFNLDETFENILNIDQYPDLNPEELPRILISHNPDIIDYIMPEDKIYFVLSGHNHNGEINLFNKIHLPLPSKYNSLLKGHYITDNNIHLFLSGGCGTSGIRTRIGTSNIVEFLQIELD